MLPNELLGVFRLEADDLVEPYLWSDEEFYRYLNDAQDVFVREIGGIADRRSPLTKITYKANEQFKTFDERIMRIKGAFDEDNNVLTVRNLDNFEGPSLVDDYGMRIINGGLDDGRVGPLRYLITDVASRDIQLYPLPDHTGYIRLFVYRRPLEGISLDGKGELEINSQFHLDLLCWVKYKAFLKQDVEAFDGSKAADFRMAFQEAIKQAKKEKSGREDRKRLMAYGGI